MLFIVTLFFGLLAFPFGVSAKGPAIVSLGTAAIYAILSKTGISTVPSSAITGCVGVSPVAATYMTGFSLTDSSDGTYSSSAQVTGRLYSASHKTPTPATITTAVSSMETAYTDAMGRTGGAIINMNNGAIGGSTLAPGLYRWNSGVTAYSDVTISGGASDVWIFQITGTLNMATSIRIKLTGGALSKNIFWVVADAVAFEASTHFEGILLAKTGVTLKTGSSMNGRILSQTLVALQKAMVTEPPT